MTSRNNSKLMTRIGSRSENISRTQRDPMYRDVHSFEHFRPGVPRSASARTKSQDDHDISRKSTVLARVKEKAKRWRGSFLRKKHSQDDIMSTTSSWGSADDDNNNNNNHNNDDNEEKYQDEDPEYLGAPMYESELAPETYKEHARQHPRAVPVIPEKHVLPSNIRQVSETEKHATHETHKTSKSDEDDDDDDQETEKHALRSDDGVAAAALSLREKNKWDKGVSVKEYIMKKLEPGEDEKVLSQVISDAIVVPTMSNHHGDHHHHHHHHQHGGGGGVMEKMKVVVNSLLGREDTTIQSANTQPVMEEENHGRILQTN